MPSTASFSARLEATRQLIAEADYVLIGAGAGLSAAAGLEYSGEAFEREFRPWIERYGITDLYSSSFYPFPSEEELWAYWARHIWFSRFRPGATKLYQKLLECVKEKDYFVITTNVDAQFEQAGFAKERIFATQGDYAYLQARSGNPKTLVYNEEWVKEALAATHDCRIPARLVPHHPQTGELMSPNVRCDATFVEDTYWHTQAERFQEFVEKAFERKLLLLEFGVGFNTPVIIRFPFEKIALTAPQATLVRFNRDYPQLQFEGIQHFVCFTEELVSVIENLLPKQ
ncbi:MAG: Sir2 silent information regulator family NAD-dependent deacetylase [Bacteroides sp.]